MIPLKKYALSRKNYKLLKTIDFSEMGDTVAFDDETAIISTSNLGLLLIIINEEIVGTGMDDAQNLCNERGRKLYDLYDELLDLAAAQKQV